MYARGETLDLQGAREVGDYLRRLPESAGKAVDAAFTDLGREVVTTAQGLAPVRTGKLRGAIGFTYDPGRHFLTVSAGSDTVPYAYTYHSGVIGKPSAAGTGKTSGGYMVFRVSRHIRRGSSVTGYNALRRITLNPYLYAAWNRLQKTMIEKVETRLRGVLDGGT